MNYDLVWLFGHPLKFRRFIPSAIVTFGNGDDTGQCEIAVEWKASSTDVVQSVTLTLMWNLATLRPQYTEIDEELEILRTRDDDQATQVMEAAVIVAVAVMTHVEPGTRFTHRSDTGTRHDYYLNETNDEMIEVAGRMEGGLPGLFKEKKAQSEWEPDTAKTMGERNHRPTITPKSNGGVTLMNAATTAEYRKLGLDSSNDLIEHDADRTLGRYPKAAWHILQAGLARVRMGQMMFDDGNFTRVAADWLSAAACFDLATDPKQMRETLDRARKLDQEGEIPPERRDLHAALKEREEQFKALEQKVSQFRQRLQTLPGPTSASPETLAWLLTQGRELPGYPLLYAKISGQALMLDQRALAAESLDWALRFDPNSPHLASLRASQLFSFGESDKAIELARTVLAEHPEMDATRFLLAQALAFRTGPDPNNWTAADWKEAVEVLQPLIANGAPNTLEKLMAVGLLTTVSHGIGNETVYRRALAAFDKLAESLSAPLANKCVTQLRQAMPHVFPQPGSDSEDAPNKPDYAAARTLFEQFSPFAVGA